MDFLLTRYRNLTVLLLVIAAQLVLLAYQVKSNKDVPLMRVWAVTAVTPVEQGLEFLRRNTIGVAESYFVLLHVQDENAKMQREMARLKLENHFLRNELTTADRARELSVFQRQTESKTLAAQVIGNGTGANSKVVFVDRGSASGTQNGMAVITPDGIVGKVVAAYPTASLVMLVTDPSFAAGVISQKNHVHGTLKGTGGPKCKVDYVQNEEKVDPGEWFYTSGDDGVFPRGFPAGQVSSVANGRASKEIYLTPSGWQGGLDEVLIVTQGIHQAIPELRMAAAPVKIQAPPADPANDGKTQSAAAALTTDADRLKKEYEQVGEREKIQFGSPGKPPDFSKLGSEPAPAGNAAAPKLPAGSAAGLTPKAMEAGKAVEKVGPGQRSATATAPPVGIAPRTVTPGGQAVRTTAGAPRTSTASRQAAPLQGQPRSPALRTDPADADPANEAAAEKAQRALSPSRVVSSDANTEILAPAPAPKRPAPKIPQPAKSIDPKPRTAPTQ